MLRGRGNFPNTHFSPKATISAAPSSATPHLRRGAIYFDADGFRELQMRVFKWGKHLAVRLPDDLVMGLALRDGDEIEVLAVEKQKPSVQKAAAVRELIAGIRKYRGRLPAGFRFSREQAHERGQ